MSSKFRAPGFGIALGLVLATGCGGEPLAGEDRDIEARSIEARSIEARSIEARGADDSVEKALIADGECVGEEDRIAEAEELAIEVLRIIGRDSGDVLAGAGRNRIELDFGPVSEDDVRFLFQTYSLVFANISNTIYQCRPEGHPDCSGEFASAQARTDVTTNVTRLCPAFFDSFTSPQKRAVVMIHELTHQNRNSPNRVGTDDSDIASVRRAFSYENYANNCFDGCIF